MIFGAEGVVVVELFVRLGLAAGFRTTLIVFSFGVRRESATATATMNAVNPAIMTPAMRNTRQRRLIATMMANRSATIHRRLANPAAAPNVSFILPHAILTASGSMRVKKFG